VSIAVNIVASLRNSLKGSGCDVFVSDMKVHAVAANSFYYPDVVVECKNAEKHELYSDAPSVIFEVLSKSTATTDRREKLVAYQMIDSLQNYVIVHQSRRRIEHHQRVGEDWQMQEIRSGELFFKCGSDAKPTIRLTLDEIYEGVQVDDAPDLQVHEDVEVYAW
jgi:Uma2 family endonuclease